MIIVDLFYKYVIFMLVPKTCPTEVTAELFYKQVVKHFGLSEDIISNRDPQFTSRF